MDLQPSRFDVIQCCKGRQETIVHGMLHLELFGGFAGSNVEIMR